MSLVVPAPGGRAADLGCGTGELTVALHRHLRVAETVGIDRSPAMLAKAGALAEVGVRFHAGDIAHFPDKDDGVFDVVAANASLHWVPDHRRLLTRLTRALNAGGQLAFQVPANFDHAIHLAVRAVAGEEPFASALGTAAPRPAVLTAPAYAQLVYDLGFVEQHVRLQVFPHLLASTAEVVEWAKGSVLTPYREQLAPDLYAAFEARYRADLLDRLGRRSPYFFPFKRILCWARRPSVNPPACR